MNLRHLNNDSLLSETRKLVQDERRISLSLLYHLREIERRLLHAELGFSSLYEYVTRGLGYGEAAAHRRIQSARLLAECPELAPKIESGSLNLSLLSQAQTFFRKEEVESTDKKREILKSLENQSSREAEKKLMSMTSDPAKHRPEKKRRVSPKYSEIRFMAEQGFVAHLEELKSLLGAQSYRETIAYALQAGLDKKRPKAPRSVQVKKDESHKSFQAGSEKFLEERSAPENEFDFKNTARARVSKSQRSSTVADNLKPAIDAARSSFSPPASEVTSRYIPIEVKRQVWARDKGQCSYQGSQSGQRCQSKFGLELDHFITPYAYGGKHSMGNLTLRCKAHNQFGALRLFGRDKMAQFVPSLR